MGVVGVHGCSRGACIGVVGLHGCSRGAWVFYHRESETYIGFLNHEKHYVHITHTHWENSFEMERILRYWRLLILWSVKQSPSDCLRFVLLLVLKVLELSGTTILCNL
jgi:hypothetical protein